MNFADEILVPWMMNHFHFNGSVTLIAAPVKWNIEISYQWKLVYCNEGWFGNKVREAKEEWSFQTG